MNKQTSKGFTLVELIIVMVLLGILAAVAVPRMSQSITAGEEAAEQKFLATLVSAVEIQANDEFVRSSRKQYHVNPFDALKNNHFSIIIPAKVGGPKAEMNGMNVVTTEETIFLDQELKSDTEEMMVVSMAGSITLRG